MDEKAVLRRTMRLARDDVGDRLVRSVDLWTRVATVPEYMAARGVMAFVGFRGEPDTDPFFARLAADGKRLLLPRVEGPDIVVCDGVGPMATSAYGVTEPTGPAVGVDVVDLVVVPGLAFTLDGGRLGYGGGFYDRFLPTLRRGVIAVGVCFDEQVVDRLPIAAHDVRVNRVISA